MSKEGSTLSGVMDTLAISLSMNFQYGVPLESLCEKLVGTRFEPMGMTANKEIPIVRSVMDYLGRWLALKFLAKERAKKFHNGELVDKAYSVGSKSKEAFAMRLQVVDEGSHLRPDAPGFGGQSPVAMDFSSVAEEKAQSDMTQAVSDVEHSTDKISNAKLQGYTGSMCGGCGSFKLKRNGSCEVCLDCGATSGCS